MMGCCQPIGAMARENGAAFDAEEPPSSLARPDSGGRLPPMS
jgi:hypothetical protein